MRSFDPSLVQIFSVDSHQKADENFIQIRSLRTKNRQKHFYTCVLPSLPSVVPTLTLLYCLYACFLDSLSSGVSSLGRTESIEMRDWLVIASSSLSAEQQLQYETLFIHGLGVFDTRMKNYENKSSFLSYR